MTTYKQIDESDREILACLYENDGQNVKQITDAVDMPYNTVNNRVKKLNELGYVALTRTRTEIIVYIIRSDVTGAIA